MSCFLLSKYKIVLLNFLYSYHCLQVVSSNISQARSTINIVNEIISGCRKEQNTYADVTEEDIDAVEKVKLYLIRLHQNWQAIFLWQDGPLVEAMRDGDLFLVDEISLADDSVLERLNSVLEPERKLVIFFYLPWHLFYHLS